MSQEKMERWGEEQGAGGEREEGRGKMKTQPVGGFFFF